MRILNVSQTYYPYVGEGGRPTKVLAISRALSQRRHRVTVLTADLGPATDDGMPWQRGRCRWGWQSTYDGVEGVYLRSWLRYRSLTLNPAVAAFCRQELSRFHLVHIYGFYDLLGFVVAHHCRRRRIPYVVEPMGMFVPIARNRPLKRLFRSLVGQRMLSAANRVIATSEQERGELVAGGVPQATVMVRRNGIELPDRLPPAGTFRRQWNIPGDSKLVLFLGRLISKKSPDLLLEAFARWRNQTGRRHGVVLVLAGPDEGDGYRQRLETLATQLGLNGEVLFTGPLYNEAKWAAYQDAELFVLPSLNENFGNTAAEAIACGTPVLVTDSCGIAPLVDQRAGLAVPHDLTAVQSGLARLLGDQSLRQRFRTGCLEVAQSLGWDEPMAVMESLYAELAGKGRQE